LENSKIKYNLSSITDEFKGTSLGSIPTWYIDKFVKDNKLNLVKPKYSLNNHYLSSKGGPCGKST
jgi:hypothetical protein